MKKSTLFLLTAAILLGIYACNPAPKPIALFNGTDLEGWTAFLDDKSLDPAREFTVRDGVIRLSGKLGYIHTEAVYSDYKLEAEWRWVDTATNSGIFVHAQPDDRALPVCFECQLKAGIAGSLYGLQGMRTAEMLASETNNVPRRLPTNERPVGEWNRAEIVCDGGSITITVNGELQAQATDASLTSGYIGLQSEGEAVEFRNVVLTPLK
jgi:hypothetical protein